MKSIPTVGLIAPKYVRRVAHSVVKGLKSGEIVDFVGVGIEKRGNVRVYVGGGSSYTLTIGAVELLRNHLIRDFNGDDDK